MLRVLDWASASEAEQVRALKRPDDTRTADAAARDIVDAIYARGDEAVREYAQRLDGYAPQDFRVSPDALKTARDALGHDETEAIRAAADVGAQDLDLREYDVAVLAAIAYHQPITRDGLKDIFGKEISRDLIGRLHARGLIGTGPRSPRRGAPYTFVTTEQFLVAFDLESLQDLPDREQLEDAGLADG